jgi:hypothetical protein
MNVTLTFAIEEINGLLTSLGQLPFVQSAPYIQAIHDQVMPQIAANPQPEVTSDGQGQVDPVSNPA